MAPAVSAAPAAERRGFFEAAGSAGGFIFLVPGEMGFAFGEKGVGSFLHVHGGEAFAEGLLFAGEAVLHAGAVGPGAGQAGGQRAAVVVGACFAAEGIGFPGCVGSIGGSAAAAGAAMAVGAVGAVAAAVAETVAGGDIGAFDHAGDGEGRFFVDGRQQLAGLGEQLIGFRYDIIYESHHVGFGCFDHASGEHDLDGTATTYELREPLGTAIAGDETEVDFGLTELRRGHAKPEMTGHGQLTTTTEGKAVDGRGDGLGRGGDPEEDLAAFGGELAALFGCETEEFGDVGACDKGALTGTGDDGAADVLVRVYFLYYFSQLRHQLFVKGIELIRSIDHHCEDIVGQVGE